MSFKPNDYQLDESRRQDLLRRSQRDQMVRDCFQEVKQFGDLPRLTQASIVMTIMLVVIVIALGAIIVI